MQALAKYASLVYRDNIDLTINVHTSQNTKHQLTISHQNALVTQELPLTVPNKVSISVEGTGCALIQVSQLYCFLSPNGIQHILKFTCNMHIRAHQEYSYVVYQEYMFVSVSGNSALTLVH